MISDLQVELFIIEYLILLCYDNEDQNSKYIFILATYKYFIIINIKHLVLSRNAGYKMFMEGNNLFLIRGRNWDSKANLFIKNTMLTVLSLGTISTNYKKKLNLPKT